jgi:hypothetical protein
MTIRNHFAVLAIMLLATPVATAMAQSAGGSGSMSPGPVHASATPLPPGQPTPTQDRAHVAGATGATVVPGDSSSVASARGATAEQRANTGTK